MKYFTNKDIAKILKDVAVAYTVLGENRFKVIAYERAGDVVEKSTIEVKDLWESSKLSNLSGIGPSIAQHIDELFRKGKVKHFEELFSKIPESIFVFHKISGVGPKTAYKLATELEIVKKKDALSKLLKAAKQGKIATLEGFGEKSQEDIIDNLRRYMKKKDKEERMILPYAIKISKDVIEYLKKDKNALQVCALGSLRRKVATIGDIDIAVSTKKPAKIMDRFKEYGKVDKVIERGESSMSVLLKNGKQVDLRVQEPESFGSMLQYFTGSKQHNISLREYALKKGFSLSEYGIKEIKSKKTGRLHKFKTENEFYRFIGLKYIPPELREDTGEIEAALSYKLPELIKSKDIKGDLHIHSDYDIESSHDIGTSRLEKLLSQAEKLGYQYIGISDHNPSHTNHTEDEIKAIIRRRKAYIEQIKSSNKYTRVNIILMLEIDILPDGRLALPDSCFDYLDSAIVAVHSSFNKTEDEMTDRIIKGLSHKKAKILAHPTGRLLNKREGYKANWNRLFDFCKNNNKALEINSYPDRLDLPDKLAYEAIKSGVKLAVNTDSHSADQLKNIEHGISVARRAWATKNNIVNCKNYDKFMKWINSGY